MEKNPSSRVEQINILLMLGSAFLAFLAPLQVFIWSFAILSPLHYFSEMSWLEQQSFRLKKRASALWLVLLAFLVLSGPYVDWIPSSLVASMIAFAFGWSFFQVLSEKLRYRVLGAAFVLAFVLLFSQQSWYFLLFAVFMTTLIHSFLFTGVFILKGALQRRDRWAMISLLFFVACPLMLLFLPVVEGGLVPSFYINSYGPFWSLNRSLLQLFSVPVREFSELFQSSAGVLALRFVAFSYLYHFLNWFSKTSLIGWHRQSSRRTVAILLAWFSCVALFAWDYLLGIQVIYFFGVLHVFLEFPLNHLSFLHIASMLFRKRQVQLS